VYFDHCILANPSNDYMAYVNMLVTTGSDFVYVIW